MCVPCVVAAGVDAALAVAAIAAAWPVVLHGLPTHDHNGNFASW
jgi:hypothetical protein